MVSTCTYPIILHPSAAAPALCQPIVAHQSESLPVPSARLTFHVFLRRDLHWGNVLVRTTTAKKGSFLLDGELHSLETKGVLVSIIDYSLSRLEIGQQHFFPNYVTHNLSLW